MKINYFVHTEIGDRPCNEDRYAVSKCPAGLCFALADGLGGLDRGEVAAELACNAVAEYAQAQAVFPTPPRNRPSFGRSRRYWRGKRQSITKRR